MIQDSATAGEGTYISNGATVSGAIGGNTTLALDAHAGNATLIANGGSNGGGGGQIVLTGNASGDTCRIEVFGNGYLDISTHFGQALAIGSLEGDGVVTLGGIPPQVGSNNLTTTFAGMIEGTGALVKIGGGTLSLTGPNSYTGSTIVSGGSLVASNKAGLATGSGVVTLQSGTLGGSGTISGAVPANSGAILAPAGGTKKQATLTIQSSVTFKFGSTYSYTFKAKGNKARTDKVVANGVAIGSGASFNFSGQAQGTLRQGLTLTVLKNTSANAIAGTFSNLPDGAILTVNGNNFQASYEGGDGNDLTLTVVP